MSDMPASVAAKPHAIAYLPSLTGLRFIAAFTILFGHDTLRLNGNLLGVEFNFGVVTVIGMPLFFVLSGFVVHYNYAALFASQPLPQAARTFILARFSRIYPLFVAVLAYHLFVSDLIITWSQQHQAGRLLAAYLSGAFSWLPIYFGNNLLIQTDYGISWSISTEFFFYFAYIFFARRIFGLHTAKRALWFLAAAIVLGYVVQLPGPFAVTDNVLAAIFRPAHPRADFLNSTYRWLFYVSPYSRIFEFILGCAAAQVYLTCGDRLKSRWITVVAPPVLIVGIFLTVTGLVILFSHYPSWGYPTGGTPWIARYICHLQMNFLFAPLMALLMLTLALRDLHMPRCSLFASRPFVFLGEISLSLYLLHPTLAVLSEIFPGQAFIPFRIFTVVFVTIAMSVGTYTLIEQPGRRALRRLLRVKSVSAARPVILPSSATARPNASVATSAPSLILEERSASLDVTPLRSARE